MKPEPTKNGASESGPKDLAEDCTGRFQELMERCGCGCGPMLARMMAAMKADKNAEDAKKQNKRGG